MKKGENYNHPKKGSMIKVEPIKSIGDINRIKNHLYNNPSDYALFTIGINTNLRASDILNIRFSQVKHIQVTDSVEIIEKKTKKHRRVTFNKSCVDAIKRLLESVCYSDGDYLFKSRKSKCLTVPSLSCKVKKWCRELNLKGNFASHSLRKSWAYHQRVTFGVDLPTLMMCLNHSCQKQTLDYICVQDEEIENVFRNEL